MAPEEPPAGRGATTSGELRQLTVIFSDLVGSTELASRLDPEDYSELIDRYYQLCGTAIRAHGGYIAQYYGDGVLAYFGYPHGVEDSAGAALRAALELLALASRDDGSVAGHLVLRIGIHTGRVVVGEVGHDSRRAMLAIGDVVNTASRAQGVAPPGGVVVTEATHSLTRGRFDFAALGAHSLKGLPDPLPLYRLVSAQRSSGRARHPVTPFLGRDRERQLIDERWALARAGGGQLVLLSGDPGIGKSRLIEESRCRFVEGGGAVRWAAASAVPTESGAAFALIAQLIRRHHGWTDEHEPEARAADLVATLGALDEDQRSGLEPLARLLGLEGAVSAPALPLDASARRTRTIAFLMTWIEQLGAAGPAVVVLDDLQWADPSSLEVLAAVSRRIASRPILVLAGVRSGFELPWPADSNRLDVRLPPLADEHVRSIISATTADRADASTLDELTRRSGGVALFAEELAHAALDGPAGSTPDTIPATLQDLLTARLDALGAARRLAYVASILHDAFSTALVADLLEVDVEEIAPEMRQLVEHELFVPADYAARDAHVWRHALFRQAAHDTVLRRDRRRLHARAAALLSDPKSGHEARIDVVGQHWSEAGNHRLAAEAWRQAAGESLRTGALAEARSHLERAEGAVGELEAGTKSTELALSLAMIRLRYHQMADGYAAPQVSETATRGRQLAEKLSDPAHRVNVFQGMWSQALTSGELAGARHIATEFVRAADLSGVALAILRSRVAMAASLALVGEFEAARPNAEESRRLLDRLGDVPPADRIQVLHYLGLIAAQQGRARDGRAVAAELESLIDEAEPFPACLALIAVITIWTALREPSEILPPADRLRSLASKVGVPMFLGWADKYGGYAEVMLGRLESLDRLAGGIQRHLALGHRLGIDHKLGLLAEAQLAAGRIEEGLATIARVPFSTESALQRHDICDCLIIEAELRRAAGLDPATVEERYRGALEIAHERGLRGRKLRASAGLARHLTERGRRSDAIALLADARVPSDGFIELADERIAREALLELEGDARLTR